MVGPMFRLVRIAKKHLLFASTTLSYQQKACTHFKSLSVLPLHHVYSKGFLSKSSICMSKVIFLNLPLLLRALFTQSLCSLVSFFWETKDLSRCREKWVGIFQLHCLERRRHLKPRGCLTVAVGKRATLVPFSINVSAYGSFVSRAGNPAIPRVTLPWENHDTL